MHWADQNFETQDHIADRCTEMRGIVLAEYVPPLPVAEHNDWARRFFFLLLLLPLLCVHAGTKDAPKYTIWQPDTRDSSAKRKE